MVNCLLCFGVIPSAFCRNLFIIKMAILIPMTRGIVNTYTPQNIVEVKFKILVNSKELSIHKFKRGVLIGNWWWFWARSLVVCWVKVWCMLGVGVEVWTKNIMYRFIGGVVVLGMSKCYNSTLPPEDVLKTYWTWRVLYAEQPTPNQNFSWSQSNSNPPPKKTIKLCDV